MSARDILYHMLGIRGYQVIKNHETVTYGFRDLEFFKLKTLALHITQGMNLPDELN
jgi:hypothetical protein